MNSPSSVVVVERNRLLQRPPTDVSLALWLEAAAGGSYSGWDLIASGCGAWRMVPVPFHRESVPSATASWSKLILASPIVVLLCREAARHAGSVCRELVCDAPLPDVNTTWTRREPSSSAVNASTWVSANVVVDAVLMAPDASNVSMWLHMPCGQSLTPAAQRLLEQQAEATGVAEASLVDRILELETGLWIAIGFDAFHAVPLWSRRQLQGGTGGNRRRQDTAAGLFSTGGLLWYMTTTRRVCGPAAGGARPMILPSCGSDRFDDIDVRRPSAHATDGCARAPSTVVQHDRGRSEKTFATPQLHHPEDAEAVSLRAPDRSCCVVEVRSESRDDLLLVDHSPSRTMYACWSPEDREPFGESEVRMDASQRVAGEAAIYVLDKPPLVPQPAPEGATSSNRTVGRFTQALVAAMGGMRPSAAHRWMHDVDPTDDEIHRGDGQGTHFDEMSPTNVDDTEGVGEEGRICRRRRCVQDNPSEPLFEPKLSIDEPLQKSASMLGGIDLDYRSDDATAVLSAFFNDVEMQRSTSSFGAAERSGSFSKRLISPPLSISRRALQSSQEGCEGSMSALDIVCAACVHPVPRSLGGNGAPVFLQLVRIPPEVQATQQRIITGPRGGPKSRSSIVPNALRSALVCPWIAGIAVFGVRLTIATNGMLSHEPMPLERLRPLIVGSGVPSRRPPEAEALAPSASAVSVRASIAFEITPNTTRSCADFRNFVHEAHPSLRVDGTAHHHHLAPTHTVSLQQQQLRAFQSCEAFARFFLSDNTFSLPPWLLEAANSTSRPLPASSQKALHHSPVQKGKPIVVHNSRPQTG